MFAVPDKPCACVQVYYGHWRNQEVAVKVLMADAAQHSQMATEVLAHYSLPAINLVIFHTTGVVQVQVHACTGGL